MAKAAKKDKEVSLETVLWNCRVALRGIGSTEKNRDAVISLVFLKFAGTKFEKRYQELKEQYGADEGLFNIMKDKVSSYNSVNVFYLNETSRWSYIVAHAGDNDIAVILDTAMADIERTNPSLKGALSSRDKDGNPVYTFFATLGATTAKLKDLIDNVNKIDEKRFQEEDLIGRVYEYFLQIYAASGTKEDGEFYTPACVVKLIAEMIEPYSGTVYDPCCGSGGMFVQSEKFIEAHSHRRGAVSVYGQEANPDTWKMAKMNMVIRGIDADLGLYNADTFTNDLHKGLKADFILANSPFNYHPWGQEKLQGDQRWHYGEPPAGNANYAWIQHMIFHLAENGKIGLVLANGALSTQTSGEGKIRENIIKDDLIEGIIAMPTQLFYSVTIPVTLWFITKNKKQKGKTVFIDARKMGHMVDRKHRDFTDEDIQKLADTFTAFQEGTLEDVKGFCAVKTTEDIAKQDYILTPGRYVGIEEQEDDGEPFDDKMKRLTSELSEMFKKSHELEDEIKKKLGAIGYEI